MEVIPALQMKWDLAVFVLNPCSLVTISTSTLFTVFFYVFVDIFVLPDSI